MVYTVCQLFFFVARYGLFTVGHTNSVNSFFQFVDFCPSGSIMLFHIAFVAEIFFLKKDYDGF